MPNLNLWHSKHGPVSFYVSHSDNYAPLGGGTSQSHAKEVSARIERSAKQTRIILSMLHNETLHWIAERVASTGAPIIYAVNFKAKVISI